MSVERCGPLRDCVAFGSYGGALATAIRRFKYEDCAYLSRPLGALLRAACRSGDVQADLVVPVPLHPRRLAERGYNQSALLSAHVALELRTSVAARAIVRTIDTAAQAELSRGARRANIRHAFRVRSAVPVRGRAIALVDDVMTTGATLAACASVLLDAGAVAITSLVVARVLAPT
jgi:ComF family protein